MLYRAYDVERDRTAISGLWSRALPEWDIAGRALPLLADGFVAEIDGAPVGYLAYDRAGSIQVLLVEPDHRRAGVGTRLLGLALADLGDRSTIRVGSGGTEYIWPGVPLDLPAAMAFFTHAGFVVDGDCLDLTRDLLGYAAPPGAYERADAHGIAFATAGPADYGDVLAFEETHHPQWTRYFDNTPDDILVARDPTGQVAGTLLYSSRDPGTYANMLGADAGIIACVGVAGDRHGQGIGTAMVVRASEVLRDEGTRTCFIGFAVREDFYRRAGYEPWRRYRVFDAP